MTGQTRVGSTVQGAGPLLPGQTRDNSYSGGSSRDMAAKAKASKSSSKPKASLVNPASSVQAAEASGLLGTMSMVPAQPTLKQGTGGGIFDRLKNKAVGSAMGMFGGLGEMYGNNGLTRARGNEELGNDIAKGSRFAYDNTLGVPTTNASVAPDMPSWANKDDFSSLFPDQRDDMNPTSTGPNGEQYFNNFGPDDMSLQSKFITSKSKQARENNPIFGIPTANAAELNYTPANFSQSDNRNFSSNNDKNYSEKNYSSMYDVPQAPTQEEISQQNNEQYGNNDQAPFDQAPAKVTRQVRGSGLFGTGKGVGNPAGGNDDPYIKELRKAYASNGGEKWLRKQFEELIAALDPTYAQMQKEGTDALNQQLWNNNTQLASVMNANNTGDSEQRAQLMAGQQRDSQTALGNLLAKLAQNKAQDVSWYKAQQAEAMSKYSQNKQQDARTLLEKIQAYRDRQPQPGMAYGRIPAQSAAGTNKPSRTEVFNWVEDALNKGYSWQEIADNAQEQGIGTETGGYLDQLLNNANKQNRYR